MPVRYGLAELEADTPAAGLMGGGGRSTGEEWVRLG